MILFGMTGFISGVSRVTLLWCSGLGPLNLELTSSVDRGRSRLEETRFQGAILGSWCAWLSAEACEHPQRLDLVLPLNSLHGFGQCLSPFLSLRSCICKMGREQCQRLKYVVRVTRVHHPLSSLDHSLSITWELSRNVKGGFSPGHRITALGVAPSCLCSNKFPRGF